MPVGGVRACRSGHGDVTRRKRRGARVGTGSRWRLPGGWPVLTGIVCVVFFLVLWHRCGGPEALGNAVSWCGRWLLATLG